MSKAKTPEAELLQGTLDLLVLKSLGAGPLHGLGVSRRIELITNGTFAVKPGSLFPALHRLEEAGCLKSFWGTSENNRRAKYYGLSKAGRRQLELETQDWKRISVGNRERVGSDVTVRAFFSRLVSLGKNIVRKKRNERDLSEEIACHLELLIAENVRDGLDESEARRTALLDLGGAEQIKEQVREVRAGYSLDAFLQDLRYGARVLWRSPLFTATAVLTLALALGASGAAFTLLKSRLLRPLDYPGSAELLQISAVRNTKDCDVSFPRFRQIQTQHDVFADVVAFAPERSAILRGGVAQQINVARVTDRFFETLARRPLLGRIFSPGEKGVALVSYDYWQNQFAGDSGTVGRVITLGGMQTKIIGVLPRGFRIPFGDFDVYAPGVATITFLAGEQMQRGAGFLKIIARCRPGTSLKQVRAALAVVDKNYHANAAVNMDADAESRAVPLRETVARPGRPVVYAVVAAVACVLIVSSVNVVNLILARLSRREREIAVRYAVGARRSRIFQQLACENILIVFVAGILAVLFARIGLLTIDFFSPDFLRAEELRFNIASIGFIGTLTLAIAVLFATISLPRIKRDERGAAVRQTLVFSSRAVSSASAWLLVVQVALSLLLATAAGLMLTSLHRLQNVNPGIDPADLFVADISPPFDVALAKWEPPFRSAGDRSFEIDVRHQ